MSPILGVLLSLTLAITILCQPPCSCVNGGSCSSSNSCICPTGFIGQSCEIYAHPLSDQTKHATLTSNFSYFYFQPTEINYYRLSFNICMILNPSLLPSLFYIQTEKRNGSVQPMHSRVETAKLILNGRGCVSFSTHYISVMQKENENFHKIVIGMRVLEKDEAQDYVNVYRSEPDPKANEAALLPYEFVYQSVTIHMQYDKYIQRTYFGNTIIFSTVVFLAMILGAVIKYLRKRYRSRVENRISEFQEFEISRYRYHSHRHNPEQGQRRKKQKIECIQVFMPATRFGEKSCYFVADSSTNFEEMEGNEQGTDCSICLNQFMNEEEIRTTPCRHQYHRECIDSWCESKLSCPICRRPLDFKKEIRKIYLQFLRGEIVR